MTSYRGKQLFDAHCASCHDNTFDRTAPNRRIMAKMTVVDTDPTMALNFAQRHGATGLLSGRIIEYQKLRFFGSEASVSEMLTHMVQRVVVGPSSAGVTDLSLLTAVPRYSINAELVLDRDRKLVGTFDSLEILNGKVSEMTSRDNLKLEELGNVLELDSASFDEPGRFFSSEGVRSTFNLKSRPNTEVATSGAGTRVRFAEPVRVALPYKGRPLNGIWATAPYLHNGSVPNLDELLKPPAERIPQFRLGSREFDPVKVGFVNEGDFEFDTTLPGNSNSGHTYGGRVFSTEERQQLIEYMKSL
jgi:hypothetical protein